MLKIDDYLICVVEFGLDGVDVADCCCLDPPSLPTKYDTLLFVVLPVVTATPRLVPLHQLFLHVLFILFCPLHDRCRDSKQLELSQ